MVIEKFASAAFEAAYALHPGRGVKAAVDETFIIVGWAEPRMEGIAPWVIRNGTVALTVKISFQVSSVFPARPFLESLFQHS